MIKTKSIDHVCLWVRSLSEAKDYYEKVFGFSCTERDGDKNTLVLENEDVHFFISEYKEHNDFISKQHLSFQVSSIDEVINILDKIGITNYEQGVVDFFKYKNYKWCEWRDPSGIRLECIEII